MLLAALRYYWPDMQDQVWQMVKTCETGQINARAQVSEPPPVMDEIASRPMQKISCDIFHHSGNSWLIVTDWFSGFPFAKKLGHTSSTDQVIKKLNKIFMTFGYPTHLRSDGGPEFRDSFQKWARRAGIQSTHSSAYNPEGNSRAEKSIQDVKNLLTKTKEAGEDWDLAFCEWRSAPTSQGVSTAQLFFGRQIRSCVLPQLLEIPDKQKDAEERMINEEENRFKRFTRHPLPLLFRDQKVWLRDRLTKRWDIPAEVRGCRPNGKSYILQTNQGGFFC